MSVYLRNPFKMRKALKPKTFPTPSDHALMLEAYEGGTYKDITAYGLDLENDNRVATWTDKFNRFDFENPVNGTRPFWDSDHQTPNGKNSVFFDGGKRVNRAATATDDFISSSGQTIIVVGGDFTNTADTILAKYNASSGDRQWRIGTDRYIVSTLKGTFDTNEQANGDAPTGWNVIMYRWNPGVETAIYLNGSTTPEVSAASPASTYESVNIITSLGTDGNGGTSLNEGKLGKIIIYKRPFTDEEWEITNENMQGEFL